MTAFVDSNVVIDVLGENSAWRSWSTDQLLEWAGYGPLLINDVVYAEVSVGFDRQADLDSSIRELDLQRAPVIDTALFAAGKAFRLYRQNKGEAGSILADFLIGAHAEALGVPLITRDPRRFRTYFPRLNLVTP
jgi:predicted nucleic acid-binding protein